MLSLMLTGQLLDVNPRIEIHGEEQKLAADIKLSSKVSNNVLAVFHPRLRAAFYCKGNPAQDAFELGDDHAPSLVFQNLGAIKWEESFEPCDVEISSAIGVPVSLSQAKVTRIRFEMMEGGTVLITMTIQCHPSPSQVSRMCEILSLNEAQIDIEQQDPESNAETTA